MWERCFKSRAEIGGEEASSVRDLFRVHDCPEFSPYRPSYSPRGLQDYLMLQEIREHEDRRDKAQRDWQIQRDREQRDWQKGIEDDNREDRRKLRVGTFRLGVATLLVVISSVVVTTLAATGVLRPSDPPPPPSAPYATILPIFGAGLAGDDGRESTRQAPPEGNHPH